MTTTPEPCPVCGRKDYVPGSLLAVLVWAISPMLGGLLATLFDWWWLLTVTFAGWILGLIIAIGGLAANTAGAPMSDHVEQPMPTPHPGVPSIQGAVRADLLERERVSASSCPARRSPASSLLDALAYGRQKARQQAS